MENKVEYISPIEEWSSVTMEYSEAWVDDYKANAWSHLCRDGEGKLKPHVSVLFFDGRDVELFQADRTDHGSWVMKVYVFKNNAEMELWIEDFGNHRILDACYA